jgi:CIC family chloride channel protein
LKLTGLPAQLVSHWQRARVRLMPTERQRLFGLTVLIGGVCGLAAVAFHRTIHWISTLLVEPAVAAPGYRAVWWLLAVPTLGALGAGVLLHRFFPQARGSGIPQVKIAYATRNGRVRLRDALGKFVVGALQIGTGSSLGREGPTVQICAGVASALGRLVGISSANLRRLLPVGAAAGVAAAFNAPIAAVTFTIEEIVGTLDQTLLSGVIVAAALAAVVERSVLGENPIFELTTHLGLDSARSLLVYALLGVAAGLLSWVFTEGLLRVRGGFARARLPVWARPAVGGLATGLLAVTALVGVHAQGITGGGYAVLGQALSGGLAVRALVVLCVLKLVATVFSYGSGGAGGIFAPTLFIGAMLGGAFGFLDVAIFGHSLSTVGAFALVGMGAFFAGAVRAPITSVLMIVEMTAGYSLILPLMIANMVAYVIARRLQRTPIYEALLEQDGMKLGRTMVLDALHGITLREFAYDDGPFVSLAARTAGAELLRAATTAGRQEIFPIVDDEARLTGVVTLEDLAKLAAEPALGRLICAADLARAPVAVSLDEDVRTAFELMQDHALRELPVVDPAGRVLGFIDEVAIAHAYMQARTRGEPELAE